MRIPNLNDGSIERTHLYGRNRKMIFLKGDTFISKQIYLDNKNDKLYWYIDHGQSAYMGAPGLGVAGAKNDLEYSLNKLDEINYVIDGMIGSPKNPDLVVTYWKGSLTPKAISSDTGQISEKINYRGISIYRIQVGKMVETWHVVDGLPANL